MPDAPCKHCNRPPGKTRMRKGLCSGCYEKPWIRVRYPATNPQAYERQENQETMEQLDAIIAEQMKCLPKWWKQEAANAEICVGKYGKTGSRVQRRV